MSTTPRHKLPSLTDYEPARSHTAVEQKRLDALFPRKDSAGRPVPTEDRLGRVEAVILTVVDGQIEMAPQVAAATAYINEETNARTAATTYAADMYQLLSDVKQTQRTRETRTKLMYWAIGAPVFVVVAGLWAHADVASLATAAAAVGGVAIAVVNAMATRAGGGSRDGGGGNSLPPPPKGRA